MQASHPKSESAVSMITRAAVLGLLAALSRCPTLEKAANLTSVRLRSVMSVTMPSAPRKRPVPSKIGFVENDVVIRDQVDVDRARAPAPLLRTPSAEGGFDLLRAREQLAWRERGCERDAGIDEGRLVGDAPGRGAVVRRAGEEPDLPVAQHRHRAVERGAHVAEIAAEREQRFSHAATGRWRRRRR